MNATYKFGREKNNCRLLPVQALAEANFAGSVSAFVF